MDHNKEAAYLLLQNQYLKQILDKDEYTEEEVIEYSNKLFPNEWFLIDVEKRIQLISKAIKEKRDLNEIYERETNTDLLPPKLDTK